MDTPTEFKAGLEVDEIKISVPWGHLCGKWWGPKHIRPIVCLHGWQDNAGTFDTLIPLLPSHVGYLALDLPGHGLSSWLPNGVVYHASDYLFILLIIMKHYNWKKISLLGHSMGVRNIAFVFASVFNDTVDLVVGLDSLKPFTTSPHQIVQSLRRKIPSFIISDERNCSGKEPPSYSYSDIIERFYLGAYQSVDRDHCKYILNRNIQRSKEYPTKYYFSRDGRLKTLNFGFFSQELNLTLAKEIKCPFLFIKALGSPYYEDRKYCDQVVEVLRKNTSFEMYEVEGTHHVHLNDPTKVSGIISSFIVKYRPAQTISKL